MMVSKRQDPVFTGRIRDQSDFLQDLAVII